MQKQKIRCDFNSSEWIFYKFENIYKCTVENQEIKEGAELNFIGKQKKGKSKQDVVALSFENCTIKRIPQELTKSFPNLKILEIYNSKLKHVEREDLKNLCQLEALLFKSNKIVFLPGDLLSDMKQLKIIDFRYNKVRVIEPNLLDGLNMLRFTNFSSNPCINMRFDSVSDQGNATLEEIKKAIRQKSQCSKCFGNADFSQQI